MTETPDQEDLDLIPPWLISVWIRRTGALWLGFGMVVGAAYLLLGQNSVAEPDGRNVMEAERSLSLLAAILAGANWLDWRHLKKNRDGIDRRWGKPLKGRRV